MSELLLSCWNTQNVDRAGRVQSLEGVRIISALNASGEICLPDVFLCFTRIKTFPKK